jgi:hypothetical protein
MTLVVTCKHDTEELEANIPYEVLDERAWGYRLLVGRVAQWFRKDMFFKPRMVSVA